MISRCVDKKLIFVVLCDWVWDECFIVLKFDCFGRFSFIKNVFKIYDLFGLEFRRLTFIFLEILVYLGLSYDYIVIFRIII